MKSPRPWLFHKGDKQARSRGWRGAWSIYFEPPTPPLPAHTTPVLPTPPLCRPYRICAAHTGSVLPTPALCRPHRPYAAYTATVLPTPPHVPPILSLYHPHRSCAAHTAPVPPKPAPCRPHRHCAGQTPCTAHTGRMPPSPPMCRPHRACAAQTTPPGGDQHIWYAPQPAVPPTHPARIGLDLGTGGTSSTAGAGHLAPRCARWGGGLVLGVAVASQGVGVV